LFGITPAVAVFHTKVPVTNPPPCGFVTGAATFKAVNATLGGTSPVVAEFISKAPLGVVVPTPT
jgi:hypothetical protein